MLLINKSITFFQKEIKNLIDPKILNSSVLFDKLFQMQVSVSKLHLKSILNILICNYVISALNGGETQALSI